MSENTTTQPERSNKRRAVVAAVLAVLAVGGIGAAATSAAWTDNVFFSATAQAATFNLQGSLDNSTWLESDNKSAIQLVVPAAAFGNLLPGDTRTVTLHVKNTGTTNAALTVSTEWAAGTTFTTNPTVTATAARSTLTAATGATPSTTVTLTVTAPANWDAANQGKTGTIIVTVAGTATA